MMALYHKNICHEEHNLCGQFRNCIYHKVHEMLIFGAMLFYYMLRCFRSHYYKLSFNIYMHVLCNGHLYWGLLCILQ